MVQRQTRPDREERSGGKPVRRRGPDDGTAVGPVAARLAGVVNRYALITVASLLAGLVAWEVLGRTLELPFLPPASGVLARLWDLIVDGSVLVKLGNSLSNLAIGFAIAAVAGVVVGVAMARIRWLEQSLDPYVYAFLTAPTVVFVPIYFALFTLSRWAVVALIVQYAVFIIIVNTVTAIKTVDRELVEMARVFGAKNESTIVRKVLLRAAAPHISAGIRLGLGRAIKGMINGEILIAVVGIGGMSSTFGRAYDSAGVLALLVLIIIVALILDGLTQWIDGKVNAWLPSTYR